MRALWSSVRSGIANVFTMHVCIECMCCLFGTQRYPPTQPTGDNMLVVLSTASLHWTLANFNINFWVRWGFEQVFVFNWILQGCTYCQRILFEQLVSSTMICVLREFQRQLQRYQKNIWISVKCWNVRPSCSSHHVECTKTWMRDLSSVLWEARTLSLKLDSQPTLVLL